VVFRIVVCIKQVIDPRTSLQIGESGNTVEQDEPRPVLTINPADRFALEEAMYLKEEINAQVVVVSMGCESVEKELRYCLARGADKAVHIVQPLDNQSAPWTIAASLGNLIQDMQFDLVICGDRSVDTCSGVVGPFLAEVLDLPQVTRVENIHVRTETHQLIVRRKLTRGDREIIACTLPALITVTAKMSVPYYVSVRRRQHVPENLIERIDGSQTAIKTRRLCRVKEINFPRPRPRIIALPDPKFSASERLKYLLSGKRTEGEGRIFESSAEESTDHVIEFLERKGFL
jgi:electron transfer flavoprotein beta subunit